MSHAATIRAAFDQVRPFIRPEADDKAGSMAVAIEQLEAAELEDAPAPSTTDEKLDAILGHLVEIRATAGL